MTSSAQSGNQILDNLPVSRRHDEIGLNDLVIRVHCRVHQTGCRGRGCGKGVDNDPGVVYLRSGLSADGPAASAWEPEKSSLSFVFLDLSFLVSLFRWL